MKDIRNREVLKVVLVTTLSKHPSGLDIHSAYDEIESLFLFPAEWYREIPLGSAYDELTSMGYADWRDIAQDKIVELVKTEPQWKNEIRWARNDLRKEGLLDETATRGIWRLTQKGMTQARGKISEALTDQEKLIATPQKTNGYVPKTGKRESLNKSLSLLTANMPLGDLELLVDIARAIRRRSTND